MKRLGLFRLGGMVLAAFLLTAPPAWPAAGEYCLAARRLIKQEKSLLKRQILLEQVTKECPEDLRLQVMYGYTLERLRKYEEALVQYQRASALDPSAAAPLFGQGDVYLVLGDAAAAVRVYEKGLELKPDKLRVQHALELARLKAGARVETETGEAESVQGGR